MVAEYVDSMSHQLLQQSSGDFGVTYRVPVQAVVRLYSSRTTLVEDYSLATA